MLLWLAGPFFLAAIVVELRWLTRADRGSARKRTGYDRRDTVTNVATGVVYQLLGIPWAVAELAVLIAIGTHVPWHLTGTAAWVVGFVAVDLAYYAYHRAHHEVRVLWAVHVVHHSSRRYNLSVALRQPVVVVTTLPFLAAVACLGVAPGIVLGCFAANLLYQFFLHTELVDRLPRLVELVLNTPSHHRVHHGTNPEYLDRNYAGVLIVWDRIFGTFEPERASVVYGLTTNLAGSGLWEVYTHELRAILADLRAARTWPVRLARLVRGPGWTPA